MLKKLISLLRDKKISHPCCVALRCVTLRCYYHESTHLLLVLEANNHGERPRPTTRDEKQKHEKGQSILYSKLTGIVFKGISKRSNYYDKDKFWS